MLLIFKVYYGVRWLLQTVRSWFIRYYRVSVTFCYQSLCFSFLAVLLYYEDFKYAVTEGRVAYTIFIVAELIMLEAHVRYIDSIHYAYAELNRDRFILMRYQELQERRALLSSDIT